MLTHVKKNSCLAATFFLTAHWGIAHAASAFGAPPAGNPAPASGAPAASNNATDVSSGTSTVDSSTSSALDYLFNHKAQEGSTMKAGNEVASALADKIKAVDVLKTPGLDDPEVRARFETYLSLKEVPQPRIDEYFGKMQKVSDSLKQGDTFGAWKILYSLGTYQDLDAGISRELAARVETFWNTDRTKNGLEIANNQLRDNIDTYNHNADLDAQDIQYANDQKLQKVKGNNNNNNANNASTSNATNSALQSPNADPDAAEAALMPVMNSSLQGKMEMTAEYLNLLEARFKIKLNEAKANKMSDQDRMDFADYITTL